MIDWPTTRCTFSGTAGSVNGKVRPLMGEDEGARSRSAAGGCASECLHRPREPADAVLLSTPMPGLQRFLKFRPSGWWFDPRSGGAHLRV